MKIIISFICIILFISFTDNQEFPRKIEKKIDKTLKKIWPDCAIIKKRIIIDTINSQLINKVKSEKIYKLINNGKIVGILCLSEAKGRFDKFDYMVIFNPDLSIKIVRVLIYRSQYGHEITSKNWLKQFIDKDNSDNFIYGKDIDVISGATISGKSITDDIKRIVSLMNELKTSAYS